jgi:hypothetical protein
MQTDNIKRLALIEPFFNLDIDFKNDYVEYISITNQDAVTAQQNNNTSIDKYYRSNENVYFLNRCQY